MDTHVLNQLLFEQVSWERKSFEMQWVDTRREMEIEVQSGHDLLAVGLGVHRVNSQDDVFSFTMTGNECTWSCRWNERNQVGRYGRRGTLQTSRHREKFELVGSIRVHADVNFVTQWMTVCIGVKKIDCRGSPWSAWSDEGVVFNQIHAVTALCDTVRRRSDGHSWSGKQTRGTWRSSRRRSV